MGGFLAQLSKAVSWTPDLWKREERRSLPATLCGNPPSWRWRPIQETIAVLGAQPAQSPGTRGRELPWSPRSKSSIWKCWWTSRAIPILTAFWSLPFPKAGYSGEKQLRVRFALEDCDSRAGSCGQCGCPSSRRRTLVGILLGRGWWLAMVSQMRLGKEFHECAKAQDVWWRFSPRLPWHMSPVPCRPISRRSPIELSLRADSNQKSIVGRICPSGVSVLGTQPFWGNTACFRGTAHYLPLRLVPHLASWCCQELFGINAGIVEAKWKLHRRLTNALNWWLQSTLNGAGPTADQLIARGSPRSISTGTKAIQQELGIKVIWARA